MAISDRKTVRMLVCGGLMLAATGLAAGERPGDGFRQAAADYAKQSRETVRLAAHTEGPAAGNYLQLAAVYRELAAIKERAAVLADVERWDEITWDRYRQLELRRDALLNAIGAPAGDSSGEDDGGLGEAADTYREQARHAADDAAHSEGAERAVFEELSEILNEMGAIKEDAAAHEGAGTGYDWSHYEMLSERRGKLERMLEAAR